jgi:YYY domain-containing protein
VDWFEPTLTWYLTTTLIALALAPLVTLLFASVTDRGASVVRPLSALIFIWPIWLLASLGDGIVPFDRLTLWIALVFLATVSWIVGLRAGVLKRASLVHLAIAEAGYLVLFCAYVWLHGFVPSVTGPLSVDQEKPSDLMMLASTMRSESMPPLDAWLSGETINYYYLGYVIWAAPATMIDTTPAIAFNLALASTFAMTVIATIGTVSNILSRFTRATMARAGGVIAAIVVILIGNPWAVVQVIDDATGQWSLWAFDGIFWNATRVIRDSSDPNASNPISEFPAFSFLLADLHPHLMAIPFTILALAFAWLFASLPRDDHGPIRWLRLAVAGIAIVALYAINSWDFPTWFVIVTGALLVSPAFHTVGSRIIAILTVLIAGIVAWLPFILAFETPVNTSGSAFPVWVERIPVLGGVLASVAAYNLERTSPVEYLSVFGFFYPVLVVLIITELFAHREVAPDPLVTRLARISGVILVLIGLLLPAPLVIMLGLPALAGFAALLRSTNLTLGVIATAFSTLAFLLTLIPEFFFLLDIYGVRMNTVFKIYLQVWILSAVATSLALVLLWRRSRRWRAGQILVALATISIMVGGLAYPVVAGSQWLATRNLEANWEGVDGLAFLEESDPATYNALQWLWDNGSSDDVILSAGGCEWYSVIGRPSAASGVPAIIGWAGHERQWHLGDDEILSQFPERVQAIRNLYARPTDDLLDEYGVTLMFIGNTETEGIGLEESPDCAPGPFPETTSPEFPGPGWTETFSEDGVRILRRNDVGEMSGGD